MLEDIVMWPSRETFEIEFNIDIASNTHAGMNEACSNECFAFVCFGTWIFDEVGLLLCQLVSEIFIDVDEEAFNGSGIAGVKTRNRDDYDYVNWQWMQLPSLN